MTPSHAACRASEVTVATDGGTLDHATRLRRLGEVLEAWHSVWQPLPFQHPLLPWEADHGELAAALRDLSDAEAERLQDAPLSASALSQWLPVEELATLVELPDLAAGGEPTLPDGWGVFVGGRKWRQIQAFAPLVSADRPLLEWCAGKGHLARGLARWHDRPVDALEWQPALCEAGGALAYHQSAAVRLHQQDVMAADAECWLNEERRVMALHACGDLHVRLLHLAARRRGAVTLAPCCYQRTADAWYQPISCQARREMNWSMSRDDLAMAVQETVTAPGKVRRERRLANAWRLGFDALQRSLTGRDRYLPVPSLAYGQLPTTFAGFCRWAGERKAVELPGTIDWAAHEAEGWRRLAEVTRLELVRHVFRRPLEVWLALDRVRLMEEAGFDVRLGTFCDRQLTPRNLVIEAEPWA
ncbi:SAM-dependent methyltransferase [Halomonas sp. 18H]|uniref:SAM-dependent methyltransferase n=1 Tax=Halomonas almeriensis TaxID=308163 RepID=UPI0022325331|nr:MULTISPECIES: SAM-dependent methyltransferase [Halomonas]MCW4152875.1 SAM-dependent methyltransferase [Halomonas sp. 18H]MDN3554201.1 SAM-dependent methyltransferase [Halomonas almeriensis]